MSLEEHAKHIKTREDFIAFVLFMRKDLHENPCVWSNTNLESFLEALAAWTADMDGYYLNRKQAIPDAIPWAVIADLLMGARVYS